MGKITWSDYTVSPREDATAALKQLRASVSSGAGLTFLYHDMAVAEWKVDALGDAFATAARRLGTYAPPTVAEIDEMLRALEEPAKTSCPACEGFRCSGCDGTGLDFDDAEAA